jgi:TPR repeat protein
MKRILTALVLGISLLVASGGGGYAQYALGGMYGNGQGVLKTSRNVSGGSIIDLQRTS